MTIFLRHVIGPTEASGAEVHLFFHLYYQRGSWHDIEVLRDLQRMAAVQRVVAETWSERIGEEILADLPA